MDKRDKVLLQKILSEANVIVELIMEDIWETINVDVPKMSKQIKIMLEKS